MPRKTILASLIISSLALTACDSDTDVLDVKENKLYTSSRIQFDPTNKVISLPNDLLFSGTTDGTLELPDELTAITAASAAGATMTYADNTVAIGALDGWSTTQPISIGVDLYENRTLDAASIEQTGAVRIIPVMLGGPISLSSDASCKGAPSLSVCGVTGAELTYGVDFITKSNGKSIVVVPLKPFTENASYMYLTTNLIKDSEDESVNGSVTYQLLKRDYAENPIGDPSDPADASAIGLQKLINHYDSDIITAVDIDASTVTHTGVFTTQSETDVMNILKTVMVAANAGSPDYAIYKPGDPSPLAGLIATYQTGAVSAGSKFAPITTTIDLPYYLETASISSYWKAVGDSPITILGAYAENPTAVATAVATNCPNANLAVPASLVGCNIGLDSFKHLTRFNPLVTPVQFAGKVTKEITVQITLPATGTAPWPVNISLHGLGTLKETTLATAAAFADQGIATIAIDMPLHGSRGFDATGDGVYEISATDAAGALGLQAAGVITNGADYANGTPLAFINIESGLTVRDNFRQAIADLLALRLQIGGFKDSDNTALFNTAQVSMHGLSLGAITGASFAAYANDATLVDLDPLDGTPETPLNLFYGLKTVSLVAPTGGLASVFNDSPTFGPMLMDELVKMAYVGKVVQTAKDEAEKNGTELTLAEIEQIELAAVPTADSIVANQDNATADTYAALEIYADAKIVPSLLFAVQTLVDPIDPINIAAKLAANTSKLHVIEIVGDGIDNLPDQVLPNGNGMTLTGTETLIRLLDIGCADTTGQSKGAVRFTKGHHSSLINPTATAGATAAEAYAATVEMQTQVVTFAEGASAAAMTGGSILISDSSVISPCPAS